MIRITVVTQTKEEVVLKVEGWMEEEAVDILAQEGERYIQQTERLVLDLTGIRSIDDTGIRLLQRWSGEHTVLRGASRFIQTLLKVHGLNMEGGDKNSDE